MEENELRGWFECCEKSKMLKVFEGVLAIWSATDSSLELIKKIKNEYITISIRNPQLKVSSEGFWTCAEINIITDTNHRIYYHAQTPNKAINLLNYLQSHHVYKFKFLKISLDPNPFRDWNEIECTNRLKEWYNVGKEIGAGCTLLECNDNMPL